MTDEYPELADFKGMARLFPLPSLVFFPCMMQALHIFEPRYRQMTADALADDRLIALVLLKPGWEKDYDAKPAVYPVACLGKILSERRLEDGRYDFQLRGLTRVRLIQEITTEKLYRTAQVELLADHSIPSVEVQEKFRKELVRLVPPWCSAQGPAVDVFVKLLKSNLPLGTICDVAAYALSVALEFKQELLETLDVHRRAQKLLHYLATYAPPKAGARADRHFPPSFSDN